ncbi:endolytic transglycosylase MltG [Patescibacteria group bacterium]|jgi:UPF0755 protein|nr:endolytic transglycosylase MltG [Patescibacteria group bacterium]
MATEPHTPEPVDLSTPREPSPLGSSAEREMTLGDRVRRHLRRFRFRYAAVARVVFVATIGTIFVGGYLTVLLWQHPPATFPERALVEIPEGVSLDEAARILQREGVVHSHLLLSGVVIARAGETNVQAGTYYFPEPQSLWTVADRLIAGDLKLDPIRVTIWEGMTSYQMAEVLAERLGSFTADEFATEALKREGYLYPDTYYFRPDATVAEVMQTMEETFFERIATIEEDIDTFGRPLHEVVTMASLLEREARTFESRRTIAGILWNRIEREMPLQVDAVFGYIQRRETFHPLYSDLEVDSPYNTYQNTGLPPGPIASPSLSSLEAAVNPIENDYLFYLTGRDGQMRYSHNYTQHLNYKRIYLD